MAFLTPGSVGADLTVDTSLGNSPYTLSGDITNDFVFVGTTAGGGVFNQNAFTNTANLFLQLGVNAGSSGTYNLSGTGSLSAFIEGIGVSGTGTFNQNGGTNATTGFALGINTGASGTYNLSSGSLSSDSQQIGFEGTGYFLQTGGTNTVNFSGGLFGSGFLYLGHIAGGSGTYDLQGGSLSAYIEGIGIAGTGTFIQSGGTNTVKYIQPGTGVLYLGFNTGASGTYNLSGGSLSVEQDLVVGRSGTGTFNHGTAAPFGGTNTLQGNLYLGGSPDQVSGGAPAGSGTYTLGGTGSLSGANEYIGYSGTGTFNQSGGTNTLSGPNLGDGSLFLGFNPGSNGTYNMDGGSLSAFAVYVGMIGSGTYNLNAGTLSAIPEYIGYFGTGIFNQGGGTNTADALFLGLAPSASGTYNLKNGSLSAANEYIGYSGTGLFNHGTAAPFGGANTLTGSLYLGGSPFQVLTGEAAGSGTYNLGGTGSLSARNNQIGYSGIGTFTQTGGTNTVAAMFNLGVEQTGVGTYNLGGGSLTTHLYETIGWSGTGTFNHGTIAPFGGTNTVDLDLTLGHNGLASGTYNLSGTGSLSVGRDLLVGNLGTGTFNQSGGTNTVTRDLIIARHFLGDGTYNLSNGSLSAVNEYIGYSGTGTFTQTGGTNTIANYRALYLGYNDTGVGTYNLRSGTLTGGQAEYIGYSGTGTFNHGTEAPGGGSNTTGALYVGYLAGASGTYNLSGTGSLSSDVQFIGYSGTGIFNQTGGTNTALEDGVSIGNDPGSSGTYNHSAGTNTIAGDLILGYRPAEAGLPAASGSYNLGGTGSLSAGNQYIGYSGTGTFTQTGGTNTVAGVLDLGVNSSGSGTYNLQGGSLSAPEEYVGSSLGNATFTQSGGTNTVGGLNVGLAGHGTYTLSNGTLTVTSVATIGGVGTAVFTQTGGSHTVNNLLLLGAPGPGASGTYSLLGGTLSVQNVYSQTEYGTLEIGFASGWYGKFNAGGTASLAGTVRPVLLGGYIPDYGLIFDDVIVAAGGRSGEFDTIADQQITPIKRWEPIYHVDAFDLRVVADFTAVNDSLTPNQQAVANMLEGVAGSATGDLEDVLNAIGNLPTGGAVADAFQQISPDKAAALPNLGFAAGKLARQTLGQRITDLRFGGREMELARGFPGSLSLFGSKSSGIMLAYNGASLAGMAPTKRRAPAPEGKWGLWFDPAGVLGDQKSTVNQTGYDFSIVGFNAGVDYRVQDNLLVGLATGYSYTDADFKGSAGGSVTSSTWPITAYAAYLPETWYAFGSLGYALNLFDLERRLSFGGLSRTAKSSPTGHQFNAYGEAGYDFKVKPFVVTPTVSLAYSYISVESFTESGADSLSLKVGSQNADSLQTGVGAKVALPLKSNSCTVVPQVYASYQHEFLNDSRGLNARLSGAGSTFNFTTDNPGRDFAVVGGNVTVFKNNLSGYVNYNAEVGRSKYTAHYIGAGLRYQF